MTGLSWRSAPIAVREKLAFRDAELPEALAELLASPNIAEVVLLSTCNRVEVYGVTVPIVETPPVVPALADARAFLLESRGVPAKLVAGKLYDQTQDEAVRHMFRVAAALDSMVVGETQILGQLKAAFNVSQRTGGTGAILGRCMERAFSVAKRVRTETGVSQGAANVSTVAVELARRVFGELEGQSVLVIGAGKMSAAAVRHLRTHGVEQIMVTNRSVAKASALAEEVGGVARPWEELDSLLTGADVVISSTAAVEPILTKPRLKAVVKKRRYRSLVIVDIAVPRDAESAVGGLDGVYLFDIDDLERVVAANLAERTKEAKAAERIVSAEVLQFRKWLREQRAVPTIRSLRHHFRSVARAEVEKVIDHLGDEQTPEQREEAIRRLGNIIVNKLLHDPMTALKSGDEREMEILVSATQRLFDLRDDNSVPGAGTGTGPGDGTGVGTSGRDIV